MKNFIAIVLIITAIIYGFNVYQGSFVVNASLNGDIKGDIKGDEINTANPDASQSDILISEATYSMAQEPSQRENIQIPAKSIDEISVVESEQDLSLVSKEMEVTFYSFPRLFNVLMHFNLMHGNTISDRELLKAASEKDHPYYADLHARAFYAFTYPDNYEALTRYELTVVGKLLSPDSIDELIESTSFQNYKNYLISDRIIVPFCETNPDDKVCGSRPK